MIADVCKYLHNWFDKDEVTNKLRHIDGTFTISDGTMQVAGAGDGWYIRIFGSVNNDGVHEYPLKDLKDETFTGTLWLMKVPSDVVRLSGEIDKWIDEYAEEMRSPYQSESFGGYSYSKSSVQGSDGTGVTWADIFADQLKQWRKL